MENNRESEPRVTVRIPPPLRPHAGDQASLTVAGATVGEVLACLTRDYPALGQRVLTPEGRVRTYVNVFVGEQSMTARGGREAPVAEGEVITIIPAVAGG